MPEWVDSHLGSALLGVSVGAAASRLGGSTVLGVRALMRAVSRQLFCPLRVRGPVCHCWRATHGVQFGASCRLPLRLRASLPSALLYRAPCCACLVQLAPRVFANRFPCSFSFSVIRRAPLRYRRGGRRSLPTSLKARASCCGRAPSAAGDERVERLRLRTCWVDEVALYSFGFLDPACSLI